MVADRLKVRLKELTWHFVTNLVNDILTAAEEEIVDAMKLIWKCMKIVMEPSTTVPLVTVLKNRDDGKRVGGYHHRRKRRSRQVAIIGR